MKGLIGYTGFVGGNLNAQTSFDKVYNSKNIAEIQNNEFDLLVCAGVSAVKWLANKEPEKDLRNIKNLMQHLKTVKVKKIVLISTIDIYDTPQNVDENVIPNDQYQDAYGKNRYFFEKWIAETFDDYLIVRLPALFGKGLKKNFIYDVLTLIPSMITTEKWLSIVSELDNNDLEILKKAYEVDSNGNYTFNKNTRDTEVIKSIMKKINFTSLVFTDADSEFPFYYLDNLWKDINIALSNEIRTLNLAVEPISCRDVAKVVFDFEFHNKMDNRNPLKYDMRSIHDKVFGGHAGYMYNREVVLNQIKTFVQVEGANII